MKQPSPKNPAVEELRALRQEMYEFKEEFVKARKQLRSDIGFGNLQAFIFIFILWLFVRLILEVF